MTRLQIAAKTTATTATQTTGVSVATIMGVDWTLVLEVLAQSIGASSHFVFEDSNNNFTTYLTDIFEGPGCCVTGAVGSAAGDSNVIRFSWRARDFPSLRLGEGGVKLRVNLAQLTGTSPSVTFQSWLEW